MTSYGAITVINAIPCGIGAAVGIRLRTDAEFVVSGNERKVRIINDPDEDTKMAEICVRNTFNYFHIDEPKGWSLSVNSQIPISRGLKSSSSACNSIISATAEWIRDTYGKEFGTGMNDVVEMIRLGVNCAKEANVTVTGAFDDACACHLGGFVMTDNHNDTIIKQTAVKGYDVILFVPEKKIRKSSLSKEELYKLSERMNEIIITAETDWIAALTENGKLIANALGIDDSIADAAMDIGALAAGVSGTGPAVSVVVKKGTGNSFLKDLDHEGYEFIITGTR